MYAYLSIYVERNEGRERLSKMKIKKVLYDSIVLSASNCFNIFEREESDEKTSAQHLLLYELIHLP